VPGGQIVPLSLIFGPMAAPRVGVPTTVLLWLANRFTVCDGKGWARRVSGSDRPLSRRGGGLPKMDLLVEFIATAADLSRGYRNQGQRGEPKREGAAVASQHRFSGRHGRDQAQHLLAFDFGVSVRSWAQGHCFLAEAALVLRDRIRGA